MNGNFPQFCLKNLDSFLNFKNCKKKRKKNLLRLSKYLRAILVIYFETFRGTFVTLEVYGHFGYFLALMTYFSHFGWLDCVNGVNQSFLVGGYNNICPSCNQIEIQNLTIGLVECGEIFVFVNYNDNQMIKL